VVIGIGRATSLQLNRPSTGGNSQQLGITQPYSEDFRLVLKVGHTINPGGVRTTINPIFLPGKLRKNEESGSDRGAASSMAQCCDSTTQKKTPQKTSMIKRRNRSNDIFTSSWGNLQRSRKAPSSLPRHKNSSRHPDPYSTTISLGFQVTLGYSRPNLSSACVMIWLTAISRYHL